MEASIFNIQRFSTKDGPGIRTTVFFKGCNLNCAWCHNPESIDGGRLLRFDSRRCISCGRCAHVCRFGAVEMINGKRVYYTGKCGLCGECVPVCGTDALEMVGKDYHVEELYNIITRDEDFYRESGGGITFSGGEPLLQTAFLTQILRLLKHAGFHTAIDTALCVDQSRIESVLPWTDLILLDIKGMDSARHLMNTGVDNVLILENAEWLARQAVDVIVRFPLVKGLNDSPAGIKQAAEFIKNWPGLLGVELLPYHNLGVEKSGEYAALNRQTEFEAPEAVSLAAAGNILRAAGIKIL